MILLSKVRKLYDGTSPSRSAVHECVDVRLDGDRIHDVTPHAESVDGDIATRIDCSELTITPGLVDCHSHVTLLGVSPHDLARMDGPEGLLRVERVLHATLVDGAVTTARDVGGATHRLKRLVDEGQLIGPRLRIAIGMLSTTGGHADFRGTDRCHDAVSRLWPAAPGRPSSIVDGPWECRKRVRELAACGADLVKLCTSPGVLSPGDALEHQDFSAEEVEAITTEAAARGLRVAAHAHSQAGIELAIRHGVHDIQHVSFMDERLADLAAERGCTVTPTSWVVRSLGHAQGLTPFVREKVEKVADVHARAVELAHRAGVPILAGTDPVLPGMHGRNYLEIVHLVEEGLPALSAWHGMTGLAAREIGVPETGTIAAGQRADLVAWREDVLEEPRRMSRESLVEVVKDGVAHRGGLADLPQRRFTDVVAELLEADGATD